MITTTAGGHTIGSGTPLKSIPGITEADAAVMTAKGYNTLGQAQKALVQSRRTFADGKDRLDLTKYGLTVEASNRVEEAITGTEFRIPELKALIGDAPASADPEVTTPQKQPGFADGILKGITLGAYKG